MMEQLRWSVVSVYLDPSVGREQAGNRTALVVSDETFNESMEVVTVLPITSRKPGQAVYPNEVLLSSEESGLEVKSVVMPHQIRTISRHGIERRAGRFTSLTVPELVDTPVPPKRYDRRVRPQSPFRLRHTTPRDRSDYDSGEPG